MKINLQTYHFDAPFYFAKTHQSERSSTRRVWIINMILKVMITGNNRNIVSDITNSVEHDTACSTFTCPVIKSRLYESAIAERPRVAIICMGNETPDEIRMYDIFNEYKKLNDLTVIVIANDEAMDLFTEHTGLERVLFLPRPVSLTVLYDKLSEIRDVMKAEAVRSGFREYINTKPREQFNRRHILVVDDDPQQLMQIKDHLRDFFEVTVINSGKQVIRALGKFKVDLIFLDYLMPDKNGPEVLKEIRKYPQFRDIPVVFLTGVSEKEVVTKTIVELKPQGYVLKPTTKADIVAKVIDILG